MIRVSAKDLTAYCSAILENAGLPRRDAQAIATCLVEANLRGTDSHGVLRLPIYVPRFRSGAVNPQPNITVVNERANAALIDGDNGLGHLVGMYAMDRAIDFARRRGIGFAVARNSNHFGAASYFSLRAAEAAMVGISASNTCPAMPAPGGRAAVVGNGPISIAFPAAGGDAVCLDISTSAGAYGKILIAAREGKPIPDGWSVDVHGKPTTDPLKAIESQLLLPFAGHKGFGIAFVIDALCASFGDTWLGGNIFNIYEPGKENLPGRVSHFFLAISTDAVGTGSAFPGRAAAMKDLILNSPRAGEGTPMFPGQIEAETRRERLRHGIPLERSIVRDLSLLGAAASLAPLGDNAP